MENPSSRNVKSFPGLTRKALVTKAQSFLKVPWRHQGRDRTGVDCVGLPLACLKELGYAIDTEGGYGTFFDRKRLIEAVERYCDRVAPSDRKPGDLILMQFYKDPKHLGILTGYGVIHSSEMFGKVCEHRMNETFVRRIQRTYRIKGIEDS